MVNDHDAAPNEAALNADQSLLLVSMFPPPAARFRGGR